MSTRPAPPYLWLIAAAMVIGGVVTAGVVSSSSSSDPSTTAVLTVATATTAGPTTTSTVSPPTTIAATTAAPTTAPTTTAAPTTTTAPATTTAPTTTVAVNGPEEGGGTLATSIDPPTAANPFGDNFLLEPLPAVLPGRPAWYGTRALPRGPDGIAAAQPTPPELENRAFPTIDRLPPPVTQDWYSDIRPVPQQVLERSTWQPGCPVTVAELRYVRVSHWGFEGKVHTGELLVNASVADDVVRVFHKLFEAHYPIESLRVADMTALDESLPTTGDGNGSGAFVCRAAKKSTRWSDHAYGTAIDLNSFNNPYHKGDSVIPELATSYLDRSNVRPGMIERGGAVVRAFASIGWGWGGSWRSLKDYMHFSQSGK